jgi:aconitate hydratase
MSMAIRTSSDSGFTYVDLATLAQVRGQSIDRYPFVIRVLLENLHRHKIWGLPITDKDVDALWAWDTHIDADVPLYVSRVILPDSSGLPVLQDLAALRDAVRRQGGDPACVDTSIPVDLIVDHSLQVDFAGTPNSQIQNVQREYERNKERYLFLKWAQQAFKGVSIHPPGTGIIHQVHLESLASVITTTSRRGALWAFPEFVIGGDSHTPMINALGVLAWGVGGIDAEAALLGQAYTFPIPDVVGVRLVGEIRRPALTTDAALLITQVLRKANVAGAMVEFFGPAVGKLMLQERATIANMAPEYGATTGFFPVDERSLDYLAQTGRSAEHIDLVRRYCLANHFYAEETASTPQYSRIIEIDLSQARQSMAGPKRPQDRLILSEIKSDFHKRLDSDLANGGFGVTRYSASTIATSSIAAKPIDPLTHGSVVLAAITSCTNTSNPVVMMAAGLLARNAVRRGLHAKPWVKTSLAPGSRVVTAYLASAGLTESLEALGFYTIGYGCTTCGGKSGPLSGEVLAAIDQQALVVAAVLSGNRNFEGRIHKAIRANYIGSPPMVIAYALAGRVDIDFEEEPLGHDEQGQAIFLRDIWPESQEIETCVAIANDPQIFVNTYQAPNFLSTSRQELWDELTASPSLCFDWDLKSTYMVEPPFFNQATHVNYLDYLTSALKQTRVLAAFGDSVTTDHISPGGEIPAQTPAGQYLLGLGVKQKDFNSYVGRRCNFEVITRGTFANIRIKNLLTPDVEGGVTRLFPSDERMTIYDAAASYRKMGVASIILAGKEYGTGSSRDWAAKGSSLLGVRAVIAEGFERIHRANLIGMGVLPLRFAQGQGWRQLGLTGTESFCFANLQAGIAHGQPIDVTAQSDELGVADIHFQVTPQVLTAAEKALMLEGGIPQSVLKKMLNSV